MRNRIVLISLFVLIVFGLILFYKANDCYRYRINIRYENMSAKDIDSIIASEVKDKLSQIEELKEVIIFSKPDVCSVYCKVFSFVLNKAQVANRVEKKLNQALLTIDNKASVIFDDNYNVKFHSFLIVNSDRINYKVLKKYSDDVLDEILGINVSSKIVNIGEQKRTAYIYFKNSDLAKYDLNLSDIKYVIEKNNILNDSSVKTNTSNSYNIETNGSIETINDIENIAVFYKDKNFSTKLKDVFRVEEGTKEPPEGLVFFDKNKAQVFAISKKSFYPSFLFQYKLKKLAQRLSKKYPDYIHLNLLNTSALEAIEIYFKNRTSIYNSLNEYKKIQEGLNDIDNTLYFVGLDSPKISSKQIFFEKEKNKITLVTNKFNSIKVKHFLDSKGINYIKNTDKKIEFENVNLDKVYSELEEYKNEYSENITPLTDKTMTVNYNINQYYLNDFLSEKNEVIDSIKAAYEGLNIGYYFDKSVKIPIVLQNKDDIERLYYYSKNYKNLVYLGSIAKGELKEDFCTIVRKNEKYCAKIILK